jgi:hypothetical protein
VQAPLDGGGEPGVGAGEQPAEMAKWLLHVSLATGGSLEPGHGVLTLGHRLPAGADQAAEVANG